MHKFLSIRGPLTLLFGVAAALTACDRPESGAALLEPEPASLESAALLPCASSQTKVVSGEVGLLGGVVALGRTTVSVPAEALLSPISVEIEIPASPYMLVDLGVNGQDHWQFLLPVTVTIDYARCGVKLLDPPVTVWHVDPTTGELLEHMGGIDNRLLRKITFVTDHFSGYAIAN